jgi:hypothetical protein
MANRVIDADVKTILDTALMTTPFITLAHLFVDTKLLGQGLSEELLTGIELLLSAHAVCLRDPRETDVKRMDTAIVFEHGPLGQGLKSTRYGQQALALDPTGILAASSTPQRTLFEVF